MPFDSQQFREIFAQYNNWVFPSQAVLLIAALIAIRLAANGDRSSSKTVAAILSFFWLWMGTVYHWMFFSEINPVAFVFGAFFIVQSIIIFYAGVIRSGLSFAARSGSTSFIGAIFLTYSLVIYPLIGLATGPGFPCSPTFGLPCPTTIFTFGLLIRSATSVPLYILPILLGWSLIGGSSGYLFSVSEDIGLAVVGISGTWLLIGRHQPGTISEDTPDLDLKSN
jgi:hypothetical protein